MTGDSSDQPPTKRVKYAAHPLPEERLLAENRRYDFTQTFDVLVGPEKKRFTVYHDMMTDRSGFFKAARSSRWTDDPRTPTDLTDHDPEDFANYLQLIYGGGCIQPDEELTQYFKDGKPKARSSTALKLGNDHYGTLFKLYILADKLEDLKSANLVMNEILRFGDEFGRFLCPPLMKLIYDSTPANSPLRAIARDTIVYELAGRFMLEEEDLLPYQLLFEIAKEYHRIKFEQDDPQRRLSDACTKKITKFPKCRYHQHNDDHPECK